MTKLPDVGGRIYYISSYARQENLYAVYETVERGFWKELAKCNQGEFIKSGASGKCIEARELIIALPESFVEYQPDILLKLFTEHFKQNYGMEYIAALHHNKRKTNYHIHLIFSERKMLEQPIEKFAARNMFYNESGKHVRTKKEILDETGQIREGCKIIQKGEVYERNLFSVKDSRFKSENFIDEVKRSYTDLINLYVKSDNEKLSVFDKDGVYLPMKKIGKNNPKAKQIEEDNKVRSLWNQTVDRALIGGVPEVQIMKVKHKEISQNIKESIGQSGNNPELFKNFIKSAIYALELLINILFKKSLEMDGKILEYAAKPDTAQNEADSVKESQMIAKESLPEKPIKSELVSKYPRFSDIFRKLEEQNEAIYQREQQLVSIEKEIAGAKGIFKGKLRRELQEQADEIKLQIGNMKRYLSSIVQGYGYKNVKSFMAEYSAAKAEYANYRIAVSKWEKQTGRKLEPESIKARLAQKRKKIEEQEEYKKKSYYRSDRSAR